MSFRVVLVGPRAGKTVELMGVKFERGVAVFPHEQPSDVGGAKLKMLADYHNAHVENSKAHQEAQDAWEEAQTAPRQEDGADIKSMSNKELVDFAFKKFGKTITGNKLQLVEQVTALMGAEDTNNEE